MSDFHVTLLTEWPVKFSPGQWLDTFIPDIPKAGGFTITSTPSEAKPTNNSPAFLELAVQKSSNPPAQWLWRPQDEILGQKLHVRVGGSFTWPPTHLNFPEIDRLVLVAGGVGINPLISIFSHLVRSPFRPREIHFLYATKASPELDPQQVLFLPRLMDLVAALADQNVTLSIFLTGTSQSGSVEHGKFPNRTLLRRITESDLVRALDGYSHQNRQPNQSRANTVCYVCGPPEMTDESVSFLGKQPGMADERVLCEKWW